MDDPRPDELLEECGRIAARLGLRLAWSDGIEGAAAKACSRGGADTWKRPRPLPSDEEAAAGYTKTRMRKRNPVVSAQANDLVLIESDEGSLVELCCALDLDRLPETLRVRSARGEHGYLRPPAGWAGPRKIQLSPDGVVASGDGYLVAAGALHPSGITYEYLSNGSIASVSRSWLEAALTLAGETQEELQRRFADGEPIPKGHRDVAIFWHGVRLLRAGVEPGEALERLQALNRELCRPPLGAAPVDKQFKGAVKFAREHPTESEKAREEARKILDEHRNVGSVGPDRLSSDWEEPVPLEGRGSVPPFPIESLLGWTGHWATTIAAEKGAALDLGAALVLDVVAGAIARNVQVSPRPGWYEPTNLYSIVALAPGQRKTPVFKAAFHPVDQIERRLIAAWEGQRQLLAASQAVYDKRRRELIDEAAEDDEFDLERLRAQMAERLRGFEDVEQLPRPRLLTEDVTPEALAGLLADHGRIIAASDEGAALFENLAGRYARGSTSWDVFNKAHSASTLRVDRRSCDLTIVFDPAITLAIATQPEVLRTLAGKPGAEGRGVLARPLYSLPAPVYLRGTTPAVDPEAVAEYERRVLNLYSDAPGLATDDDDHPRPLLLTLVDEARAAFEQFELELNREREELGGDLDEESVYLGWLSKLAGQTARLAAVLHVADYWTRGNGAVALVIDRRTVERAITLARYYRSHALVVFGLMGELPEQRLARSILSWLRSRTPEELAGLTIRDVQRSRGKGTKVDLVRVALRVLEEYGHVRLERPMSGKKGRPPERVFVHPENQGKRPDRPDTTRIVSGLSGRSSRCSDSTEPRAQPQEWLARDGVWRSYETVRPASPGEVIEERRISAESTAREHEAENDAA